MTLKSNNRKSGFTLIELLVVIAIIGILAAMLFPAIQGALLSAKATQSATKLGLRGFTGLIFQESLDRSAVGQSELFPSTLDYAGSSSTQYFQDMVDSSQSSNSVDDADFSMFDLPGNAISTVTGTNAADFSARNNGWNVVLDLDSTSNPSTPFLFSYNINIDGTTIDRLNPTVPINETLLVLGQKMAIVVYAQGAVKVLKKKQLSPTTFNPANKQNEFITP